MERDKLLFDLFQQGKYYYQQVDECDFPHPGWGAHSGASHIEALQHLPLNNTGDLRQSITDISYKTKLCCRKGL